MSDEVPPGPLDGAPLDGAPLDDAGVASAEVEAEPVPHSPGAGPAGRSAVEFDATHASEDAGGGGDDGDETHASQEAEAGPTLEAALEAILMVVDEPVAEVTLAQVLERPTHEVAAALRKLAAEYTASGRGFDLREVAGGWRFYTRADCAPLVERFVRDGQQTRLTQAALETLAVVAYRQPVSRARVAAVRGVNSDGVMRTLVARGLVEEAGTDPESQAVLYRTSSYFLERLGLRDLSELPELAPFLPDDVENLEETTK
jgi:segregation and condensation protein B